MRMVPPNRLLLQPTIQKQWLEQYGEIEFQLAEPTQIQFQQIWNRFQESHFKTLAEFVASMQAKDLDLHEQDELFSLLVGAAFIQQHYANFSQRFLQPNLVWSIRHSFSG